MPRAATGRNSRPIGVSLAAMAVAVVWGGVLVVSGLSLLASTGEGSMSWLAPLVTGRPAAVVAGFTAVAMGQFVFMVLVADRLFPRFANRFGWRIEVVTAAVMVAGLAATAAVAVG